MEALVRKHQPALALLDRVLDCTPRGSACLFAGPAGVDASHDGDDITLSGPIRASSGIAQVLLLQYLEGMPRNAVGWGRVSPELEAIGRTPRGAFRGLHTTALHGRASKRRVGAERP